MHEDHWNKDLLLETRYELFPVRSKRPSTPILIATASMKPLLKSLHEWGGLLRAFCWLAWSSRILTICQTNIAWEQSFVAITFLQQEYGACLSFLSSSRNVHTRLGRAQRSA